MCPMTQTKKKTALLCTQKRLKKKIHKQTVFLYVQ